MEFVSLYIHEVELVLYPVCGFGFLYLAFGLSEIGRDDDVCSLKRCPSDVAKNFDFDDFSNDEPEAVVFLFFNGDNLRIFFVELNRWVSGENQHHLLRQVIFVELA